MCILQFGCQWSHLTILAFQDSLTAERQNQVKSGSSLDSRSISGLIINQVAASEDEALLGRLEKGEKQGVCLSVIAAEKKYAFDLH